MMMLKKYALCVTGVILFCTAPMSVYADMSDGFARISAAYGDNASKYITKVPYDAEDVNVIHCAGEDASVYTETNIRTNPSAEVEKVTTIGTDAKIKVRGFTDNGWCRIWCRTADGSDLYGWIKGDLLNPAGWSSQPANPEPEAALENQPNLNGVETSQEGETQNQG